ncbi:hypothetical protein AXG93_1630s1030 [Marchantia polymorpha subsp. ruderalis]|uniref:Uncharacterized protein n=1 Tax=Marchantia polymorpha subsp. ruderalis TaxID=1480154 RepID=A0A176VQK0_MARPO|nr:hypothetical protein AXG93_1630s1030 [Marchantia polymorpha subsp. ruderalis]
MALDLRPVAGTVADRLWQVCVHAAPPPPFHHHTERLEQISACHLNKLGEARSRRCSPNQGLGGQLHLIVYAQLSPSKAASSPCSWDSMAFSVLHILVGFGSSVAASPAVSSANESPVMVTRNARQAAVY